MFCCSLCFLSAVVFVFLCCVILWCVLFISSFILYAVISKYKWCTPEIKNSWQIPVVEISPDGLLAEQLSSYDTSMSCVSLHWEYNYHSEYSPADVSITSVHWKGQNSPLAQWSLITDPLHAVYDTWGFGEVPPPPLLHSALDCSSGRVSCQPNLQRGLSTHAPLTWAVLLGARSFSDA